MKGRKSYRIVVAEPYDPAAVARLEEIGQVDVLGDSAPDTLIRALPGADALLVRTKAHVTARIIDAGSDLKVIGRASPTVDHIDLRAAQRRNIRVVYAPHAAVTSTAEFALGLILALSRQIPFFDKQMRDGQFDALRAPRGHEMSYLVLGLLGVDPVAEKLGAMCSTAFGQRIQYYDPTGREPVDFTGQAVTLETLLSEADVISIHLPLRPHTRGLINDERLGLMKRTAMLINTSRGGVVDGQALARALMKHQIAGAALDVFDIEPLPNDHALRKAPNCILTPHVAGATLDATASRFSVADDVVRVLQGESPLHAVESDGDND